LKALVWRQKHEIGIEEVPQQEVGPGEMLVKMESLGICGSDLKLYAYGVLGTLKPARPFVMGHEGTGHIIQVGDGVEGFSTGDPICINPQYACQNCFYCRRGEQNLCEHLDFKSVTGDGVFSEVVRIKTEQAIRLPANFDLQLATMIEPLSVAVQASRQVQFHPDDTVLLIGAGTIGLLTLAVLRQLSVKRILVVDVQEYALQLAEKLGASGVANPKNQDLSRVMQQFFGVRGPDIVVEAAGSSATQSQAFDLARPGGALILIGISPDQSTPVNVNRLVRSNLRVYGTVRTSGDTFATAASLLIHGHIDPRPLISRIFPFDSAREAFEYVLDKQNQATKCLLALGEKK
jgi:L-iditol 2-dehydrogenase